MPDARTARNASLSILSPRLTSAMVPSALTFSAVLSSTVAILIAFLTACVTDEPPLTPAPVAIAPVSPVRDAGPAADKVQYESRSYPTLNRPRALTFDGDHIWIANLGDDSVSKMSLDGTVIDTYGVGSQPQALAFDGESIWVGTNGQRQVTKLSLEGQVLARVRTGDDETAPSALLFDGDDMWAASSWGETVTKIALDGSVEGIFNFPGSHPSPWALAWDGEFIWAASLNWVEAHKYRQDGTLAVSYEIIDPRAIMPGGSFQTGGFGGGTSAVEFDGDELWLTFTQKHTVIKLGREGTHLGEFPTGHWPSSLLFDGQVMWVANYLDNTVMRLALDGTLLDTFQVGRGPYDLAFDGQAIWAANYLENTVTRLSRNSVEQP